MKTLMEKIKSLYPSIEDNDFVLHVRLQNNLDGLGDYIAYWNHPIFAKPTDEQLKGV
jgi:hypothetical protein